MQEPCVPISTLILAIAWFSLAGAAAAQSVPQGESGTIIRTGATEVLLDLVVRDKNGRLVKNLKPGEVEVYEDGVRQQVLSFRPAVRRDTQQQRQAGEPKRVAGAVRPLRSVNPVCIVFHNLDPVNRTRAIEIVDEFLKSDLPPETYIGLFVLDDDLKAVHPFTADRDELRQAVKGAFLGRTVDFARASEALLTANPNEATVTATVNLAGRATTASVNFKVSGGEVSKTVISAADVSTGAGANALRGDRVRERGDFSNILGMRQTDQVITMIKALGPLPGRKSVLLVTTGLTTTGDPERLHSILASANRSGITIYSLDARGLDEASTTQAGRLAMERVSSASSTQGARDSSLSEMREKSRQGDNMNDAVRTSDVQASLRALSEGTGGFLIANTNDFRKPFQSVLEDLNTHYEVAYRPASNTYDGRLRKIQVKLARTDLTADSRTGYFAMPDLKGSSSLLPFETTALAVLNAPAPPRGFDLRTAAFRFRNDGTNAQTTLAFEIPGAGLAATPVPSRSAHRVHVSVLALIKDAAGQVVDKYSLDAPYEIPDANLAAAQATAITYTHLVSLPPGRYKIETAVLDREGGRSSTNLIEFESPQRPKGIDLSSVMLVQQVETASGQTDALDPLVFQGKRVVPSLVTDIKAAAKPYVYFVVYPGATTAEKPKIRVEFLNNGQLIAQQTAGLGVADANGNIPMLVGAVIRPGDCELRITAFQGAESVTQSVKYTVAAK